MNGEEPRKSGLHIDSDWKSEAAREKETLAEKEAQERRRQAGTGEVGGAPPASFLEVVNLLAMQAIIALGGYQGPGGERIAANPLAAKYHIDLLEVLEKKTAGNLTEEEQRVLASVLYELRMNYVQFAGVGAAPSPQPPA